MSRNEPGTPGSTRRRGVLPWVFAITLGVLLGVGAFTFRYAEGLSYLSTDPAACRRLWELSERLCEPTAGRNGTCPEGRSARFTTRFTAA